MERKGRGGGEGGGRRVYCWLGGNFYSVYVQMIVLEQKNKDGSWPRATE